MAVFTLQGFNRGQSVSKTGAVEENMKEIHEWLLKMAGDKALFISVRFGVPPETKDELCRHCGIIFARWFRVLVGRSWYRSHNRRIVIVGFQENGYARNMHAHFIVGLRQDITPERAIQTLKSLSDRLKIDVWDSEQDKEQNPKRYGNDIMVKTIYSEGAFSYSTKEMVFVGRRITNDTLILDVDLFNRGRRK
ncbi:MAG: hypothetical protein LBT45_02620 [Rickettsiales bacterium]|jgi:hypothetical protein|nr:hypothetical protein [Rickettsiales bacterium]